MGIITTGIVSFTLLSLYRGFGDHFLSAWFRAWLTAYVVVIPAILLIGPKVQQFVERLFQQEAVSTE